MEDPHDEIMEEAVELISRAATLLGWSIAVHSCGKKKEFIDGIIVGHQKYIGGALDAFTAAEEKTSKKSDK